MMREESDRIDRQREERRAEGNWGDKRTVGGGTWTHRQRDIHTCDKPIDPRGVSKYDRWKCFCGIEWIVKDIVGDQIQRSLVWADYKSWMSGPFAPGTK